MKKSKKIWLEGYGVIKHKPETVKRIEKMVKLPTTTGILKDEADSFKLLAAADRVASAAMWLVVHQVYARNIYIDGRALKQDEFKKDPQGHTGGSLNMVPGYVGYMLINALTGITRGWVMGQGHTVSAINSVNTLLGNMLPSHKQRYLLTEEGLRRFVRDFYSYKLNKYGKQDSPLGSHVNPNTAGGILEGGYLGFAQLQYAHMPLPGERLVAFLSDGAFEEQRGGDWTPRWWRAEDCGLIAPIMIYNGRRIDQRSTVSQEGGVDWLVEHLRLNNYDPIVFDGRDPSAFAWVIFEIERRLKESASQMRSYKDYPVRIPYGIAVAPKGAGFYNEGTNYAHSLPLAANPNTDKIAASHFNTHARKLWVEFSKLKNAVNNFANHKKSNRKQEKDNPIANRSINLQAVPLLEYKSIEQERTLENLTFSIPMEAIDKGFLAAVKSNPNLRPRVGNPDEMRSNKMTDTLEELEFRVTDSEGSIEESIFGKVITVLNEEAVAGAAFGNKGGINIIVTYEAFGTKIFGGARQEVIFSKHQKELGRPAGWLSVPIILTSHTWENGKNEQSHQDPSMAEAMFAETADISRVLFPADYNSAAVVMQEAYQTHGQIWTVVVSKRAVQNIFSSEEACRLIQNGADRLYWAEYKPKKANLSLVALGGYQLREALRACKRLKERKIPFTISYLIEPGRFRVARNEGEAKHLAKRQIFETVFPGRAQNLIVITHTRPEQIIGSLNFNSKRKNVCGLGFINEGGTLDADGMLFVNKTSWAHILRQAARFLAIAEKEVLSKKEIQALNGKISPDGVIREAY
jgi:phosphoketolase